MLVDFSSRPPTTPFAGNAPHLSNYRRVYRRTEENVKNHASEDPLADYLGTYERLNATAVVIKARDASSTFGFRIPNEVVADFCRTHADRYLGFASVDPHRGEDAIREFEAAIRELELRGLNIQCFEHQLNIDDARLYPFYAKCVELDVPVNIHCGINFSTNTSMMHGHPLGLDRVMCTFPRLRVCASPPGWPWVNELLAVAWRHPNVWIGTVAMRPKLMATPHSGYEPLLQYGRTVLKDKMLFGTGFPMMPIQDCLDEFMALEMADDTRRKWLELNAKRFLGI